MSFHNHEENIEKASKVIYVLSDTSVGVSLTEHGRNEISAILQSFIDDAEIGHARIKELENKIEGIKKHLFSEEVK